MPVSCSDTNQPLISLSQLEDSRAEEGLVKPRTWKRLLALLGAVNQQIFAFASVSASDGETFISAKVGLKEKK